MNPLLKVENLHVSVGGRRVLKGVSLEINRGETHVLMGPNASGKTTLVLTLVGYPQYRITRGRILFEGRDISDLEINERVRMGIGVAFQRPPSIRGVRLGDLLRLIVSLRAPDGSEGSHERFVDGILERLGMDPTFYRGRHVNVGFSGGEIKKCEVAQVLALRPKLMIFDEPDSGVDIDSLRLVGEAINAATEEFGAASLIITHYRHILRYLKPDVVHVLHDGRIISSGEPGWILERLGRLGYEGYAKSLMGGS